MCTLENVLVGIFLHIRYGELSLNTWASLVAQRICLDAGDLGLIPGLGRSPGEGNWQRTPVSWPGEFLGL